MFDSSNRGWLIKLIEEVEEDMVEDEEVEVVAAIVAAIVESELVEIVLCSDIMKRIELRLNWSKQEYTTTRKNQRVEEKREKQRENDGNSFRIFCKDFA